MTQIEHLPDKKSKQVIAGNPLAPPLKFGRDNSFQAELRRRVDSYFKTTGKPQRDCPQMYVKSVILLLTFASLYTMLVFFPGHWYQAIPAAILLGLTTAALGFNLQHDGGHHAYSKRAWINKAMAMSLDFIGGSSYLWHYKHVIYHHTYVNITGEDTDIDLGGMVRLSPHQKRHFFHRWQHFYVWPLYGVATIHWHLYADFKELIRGRIGDHKIPRPKGWDLFVFLGGKLLFLSMAFVVPTFFHPFWMVCLFYAVAACTAGIVLSIVFQLAHAVEAAEFPMPVENTTEMEHAWAVHQVETTVDFGRKSWLMAWLLGGLNFQIEHHLLPKICHVNFPALSKIVEQTCHEYGIKYTEHRTFGAGVASHFRWLREMGLPNAAAAQPSV